MSQNLLWQAIERGEKPAYWNDGKATHAVEGAEVLPGIFLAWTKCQRDVPDNQSYVVNDGADTVTCAKCDGHLRK